MEHLREELERLLRSVPNLAEVRARLDDLVSVYPFNEFEYIISVLLGADVLTLDAYQQLRDEYISRNMYLYIFEISSPRGFGETWAQGHLKEEPVLDELSTDQARMLRRVHLGGRLAGCDPVLGLGVK